MHSKTLYWALAGVLAAGAIAVVLTRVLADSPADVSAMKDDREDAAREHRDHGSTSTSQPRSGTRRHDVEASETGGDAGLARERAEPTSDVIGERGADAGPSGEDADVRDAVVDAVKPMAALGESLGIDTTMDDHWTLEDEAAQWFGPVEQDFQASRPMDPDRYKQVLRNHQETATHVLKRSAEIGDELGPDKGIEFLEAYNELVEGYREEAYSSP